MTSTANSFLKRPKDFLKRHAALLGGLLVAGGGLAYFLLNAPKPISMLPGPRYEISERSRLEVRALMGKNPHVIAAFIIKYKFKKGENPITYYWSTPAIATEINKIVKQVEDVQKSDKGMSSEEAFAAAAEAAKKDPEKAAQQLRNSEAAKNGLVICGPLTGEALLENPTLVNFATGVCYATIPPFDVNTHIAVIALIDAPLEETAPELQLIRRTLLQLQIDIFNRDFQGLETWIYEGT